MLSGTCVVVPTYWTRPKGAHQPGDALYDHPTPVDGEDTLEALLDSLAGLEADFSVLILVAVTTEQVRAAAEQRVREIADSCLAVHTLVFGGREYALLQEWLGENNHSSSGE